MSLDALRRFAGPSADAVSAFLGAEVVAWTPVARLRPAGAVRGAARATLADGREVKVRRLSTAEQADLVARLLAELDDARLPTPTFRHGRVLVEPWIAGDGLADVGATPDDARALGDLLGALHARPRALGVPLPRSDTTAYRRARLTAHLADLVAAGVLAPEVARVVADEVEALDPREAAHGVIHRDLCPENVVVTASGGRVVVDNEGVSIGALDGDVARTFARWPMDDATRAAFLAGYAARRDPSTALRDARFWRFVAIVKSLHVRAVRLGVDASAPRAQLEALLDATSVTRPRGAPPPTAGRS